MCKVHSWHYVVCSKYLAMCNVVQCAVGTCSYVYNLPPVQQEIEARKGWSLGLCLGLGLGLGLGLALGLGLGLG